MVGVALGQVVLFLRRLGFSGCSNSQGREQAGLRGQLLGEQLEDLLWVLDLDLYLLLASLLALLRLGLALLLLGSMASLVSFRLFLSLRTEGRVGLVPQLSLCWQLSGGQLNRLQVFIRRRYLLLLVHRRFADRFRLLLGQVLPLH